MKNENCNLCSLVATMNKASSRSRKPAISVDSSPRVELKWIRSERAFSVHPIGFRGTRIRIVEEKGHDMRSKTAKSAHGPYINPALVRSWLRGCSRLHGSRCPDIRSREQRADYRDTPLFLIDVDSMCLVSGSTSWRYLTLSYCWGVVDEWRLRLM